MESVLFSLGERAMDHPNCLGIFGGQPLRHLLLRRRYTVVRSRGKHFHTCCSTTARRDFKTRYTNAASIPTASLLMNALEAYFEIAGMQIASDGVAYVRPHGKL